MCEIFPEIGFNLMWNWKVSINNAQRNTLIMSRVMMFLLHNLKAHSHATDAKLQCCVYLSIAHVMMAVVGNAQLLYNIFNLLNVETRLFTKTTM